MADLSGLAKRLNLKLAILTVPTSAAQRCAEELVSAGIRGILNFAPIQLSVPKTTRVQNVDIAQSLAVLSHSITREGPSSVKDERRD